MHKAGLMGFWEAFLGFCYIGCIDMRSLTVGDSGGFPKIYGGLPLVTPLPTPLERSWATKSFCRNKRPPLPKKIDPCFLFSRKKPNFPQLFVQKKDPQLEV